MIDFVKYHVPEVTIDGPDVAVGPATLRLYGHVTLRGMQATFVTEDWAGPTVTDWKNERPTDLQRELVDARALIALLYEDATPENAAHARRFFERHPVPVLQRVSRDLQDPIRTPPETEHAG